MTGGKGDSRRPALNPGSGPLVGADGDEDVPPSRFVTAIRASDAAGRALGSQVTRARRVGLEAGTHQELHEAVALTHATMPDLRERMDSAIEEMANRVSVGTEETRLARECEAIAAIAEPDDSSRRLVEKLAARGVHLHERAVRRRVSRMRSDLGEVAHPGSNYVGRERGRRLHEDKSGRVACRWRDRRSRRNG